MALNVRSRRAKRLLEEHDGENCNGQEEVQAMDNYHRLCPLIAETGNIGFAIQAMHQSKSMKSRNVAQSLVAQKNGALMLTENSANNTNSDVDNTDGTDKLLIFYGTLGSIGDGLQNSLMMFILSEVINSYGSSSGALTNDDVDKFPLRLFYVAIGVRLIAFVEGLCWTRSTAERQLDVENKNEVS